MPRNITLTISGSALCSSSKVIYQSKCVNDDRPTTSSLIQSQEKWTSSEIDCQTFCIYKRDLTGEPRCTSSRSCSSPLSHHTMLLCHDNMKLILSSSSPTVFFLFFFFSIQPSHATHPNSSGTHSKEVSISLQFWVITNKRTCDTFHCRVQCTKKDRAQTNLR